MYAVFAGDETQLDKLLESANTHCLDFMGEKFGELTPLTLAVSNKHSDLVEKLLYAGASVDFYDGNHQTPLMCAAKKNKDIANVLLRNGANVNATDGCRYQALHYTIRYDKVQTASLLLESGADLHHLQHSRNHFKSALIWDRPHLLKLLLHHAYKRRMHISLKTLYNRAIEYAKEECAIVTLKQGYYPHLKSSADTLSYRSCFHEASCHDLIKLMGFLLELNPHFMQEDWLVQRDPYDFLCPH